MTVMKRFRDDGFSPVHPAVRRGLLFYPIDHKLDKKIGSNRRGSNRSLIQGKQCEEDTKQRNENKEDTILSLRKSPREKEEFPRRRPVPRERVP